MSKLAQSAPQSFRSRMFRQDAARPREQWILVLKTGIAGVQFYIESEEEQAALDALTPGTELLLYREADNQHDEWAVAVYRNKEDKIGFLSRFKNETIARLMDAGKRFVCVVDEPKEMTEEEAGGQSRNRHAPTENMSLPLSVYLIEEG